MIMALGLSGGGMIIFFLIHFFEYSLYIELNGPNISSEEYQKARAKRKQEYLEGR